jgi:pyrimidine operon attenuation protein/uracil phosphoribosyltransferase
MKKIKLKSFKQLEKEDKIYRADSSCFIVQNRNYSWKSLPRDIWDKEIIVSDDIYVMGKEEYEAFKELFEDEAKGK